ncbi:hypothetical protein V2G26_020853 [Clonostachys chloroleuca]
MAPRDQPIASIPPSPKLSTSTAHQILLRRVRPPHHPFAHHAAGHVERLSPAAESQRPLSPKIPFCRQLPLATKLGPPSLQPVSSTGHDMGPIQAHQGNSPILRDNDYAELIDQSRNGNITNSRVPAAPSASPGLGDLSNIMINGTLPPCFTRLACLGRAACVPTKARAPPRTMPSKAHSASISLGILQLSLHRVLDVSCADCAAGQH